jgi:outer membrane protein
MKKTVLIFIAGLFLILKSAAQDRPSIVNLQTAIDLALKNNPDAKQADLVMQAADVRRRQSAYDLLPDLNGNVNHGMNQGRSIDPFTNTYNNQKITYGSYSLGSSLLLFNGLQLQHNLRQSRYTHAATKEEWQQVKDNLTLNVILAYLQILSAEEQVTASGRQAEVTRKQVERLEILNKEGAIAPALLYDLQGQLANDELAIVNNENQVSAAKLALARLMNIPYNKNMKLEPVAADNFIEDESLTSDSIFAEAEKRLSVIKAVELRKAAASEGVKVARSGFFPAVGLNGNLFTNYSSGATTEVLINTVEKPSADFVDIGGSKFSVIRQQSNYSSQKINYSNQFKNNYSSSVSIGVRIPLFNGFRTKNQIALAKIDLKNAEFLAKNSRLQLRQEIEQAHFNMTAAHERFLILNRQVNSFAASFRSAEVKFNAGASTQVDYLIAKNNLDRANINLISSKYDYLLRKKLIDFYLGRF